MVVFFAALVAVDNPEHIAAVIAEAVGFQFQGDASRSEMQQLLDYLANKQMLIVLDNFGAASSPVSACSRS